LETAARLGTKGAATAHDLPSACLVCRRQDAFRVRRRNSQIWHMAC